MATNVFKADEIEEARKCFLAQVVDFKVEKGEFENSESLVSMIDRATKTLDPELSLYYPATTVIINHPLSKEDFGTRTQAVDLYCMKAMEYISDTETFSGRNCKAREIKANHMYKLLNLIYMFLKANKYSALISSD
jgi:hypothetical protein